VQVFAGRTVASIWLANMDGKIAKGRQLFLPWFLGGLLDWLVCLVCLVALFCSVLFCSVLFCSVLKLHVATSFGARPRANGFLTLARNLAATSVPIA